MPIKKISRWATVITILMVLCGPVFYLIDRFDRKIEAHEKMVSDTLSEALQIADVAYWQWDMDSDEILWSKHLREIYGIPGGSVATYDQWLAAVHPDDRVYADAVCLQAAKEKEAYEMRYRIIDRDDEIRYIYETAAISKDGRWMVGVCIRETPEPVLERP